MTRDAPAHREGGHLGDHRHRLYRPVTGLAREPDLDVTLVRELDEPRHLVDAGPRHRSALLPVCPELLDLLLQLRVLGRDDLVAAHAAPDRRHPGVGGAPGVGVTVLAVDLEVAGVDPVAEEYRLPGAFGGGPGSRRVGAPDGPARQEEEEDRARKRPPGAPKPHATPHPPRPRRTMSLAGS